MFDSKVSPLNRCPTAGKLSQHRRRFLILVVLMAAALQATRLSAEEQAPLAEVLRIGEWVYLGALPSYREAATEKIELIIDLRYPYEGVYEEVGALRSKGIESVNIPVSSKAPTLNNVMRLEAALDTNAGRPVLIHDSNGHRTAALWGAYQLWKGRSLDRVVKDLEGLYDSPDLRRQLERFHREAMAKPAE